MIIQVKNLSKKYGNFTAIKDVNLNVAEKDFYGFIGPNGAGKTTTIKSILNIIHKNSGEVKLFDENHDLHHYEDKVGYIPGEASLYEYLTVKEQIDYFKNYYDNIDEDYVDELINYFEIDLSKKIKTLSLGNKKKVSLVCTLLHKPQLLILDEVTNGLDPLMQKKVFDKLIELNKEGVTIFLSSHNLNDVTKYCNKIAVIKDGKIILDDKKDNIIKNASIVTIKAKKLPDFIKKKQISYEKLESDVYKFFYDDDINELISLLQEVKIEHIEIKDISLEDMFEHLYRK